MDPRYPGQRPRADVRPARRWVKVVLIATGIGAIGLIAIIATDILHDLVTRGRGW